NSVVTTRRVLERFVVHYFSQRAAWKFLKDIPKPALRKSNKGCHFILTPFVLAEQHLEESQHHGWFRLGLNVTAVGHLLLRLRTGCQGVTNIVVYKGERAKVLGKRVCGITVRCGASLVFASIGAGISATLLRPKTGQSLGKHHTTRHACLIVFKGVWKRVSKLIIRFLHLNF
nr:hypothetical protein [Tanacetum cinerariifolium]